jgi:hypothetical protein
MQAATAQTAVARMRKRTVSHGHATINRVHTMHRRVPGPPSGESILLYYKEGLPKKYRVATVPHLSTDVSVHVQTTSKSMCTKHRSFMLGYFKCTKQHATAPSVSSARTVQLSNMQGPTEYGGPLQGAAERRDRRYTKQRETWKGETEQVPSHGAYKPRTAQHSTAHSVDCAGILPAFSRPGWLSFK